MEHPGGGCDPAAAGGAVAAGGDAAGGGLRLGAGDGGQFDLVAEISPGQDPSPWEAAGATWVLTSFDSQPHEADVRSAIDAGP